MTLSKQGIRSCVAPGRGMTEIDIAHEAAQMMIRAGADLISDFHEVKPTPKDIHEHGKNVRVFTAVAYNKHKDAA